MALSAKQNLFVDALLLGKNLAESARLASAGYTTARRWWKDPEVKAEYDERRHAARDLATGRLQEVALSAVATLVDLQSSPDGRVARAAADALLRHMRSATQQDDLLDALKRLLEQIREGRGGTPA